MSKPAMRPFELRRARSRTSMVDKCAIVPLLACAYATMIGPLLDFAFSLPSANIQTAEPGVPNRIFWPVMALVSVILAAQHSSRRARPTWPPNARCLLAYLAFAGASVLWSFNPGVSFTRFAQQAMIVTSIVLPAMLAAPTADMMRGLFLYCFAPAAILNIFFVINNSPSVVAALGGYPG